jgi:hypothetical protein
MNGKSFSDLIDLAFRPFLSDLGFNLQPIHVSGRYYRANFVGNQQTLTVSFEPGDESITIMLIKNTDDSLDAIDDSERAPRLSDLNKRYMSKTTAAERTENDSYFGHIERADPAERLLLKCAKELRLVLPLHLGRGL